MIGKKKIKNSPKKGAEDSSGKKEKVIHNKLVRDKIPKIIYRNGGKPITRTVQGDEFREALKLKILEEANELVNARTKNNELEEIIDIIEAINEYMKLEKVSVDDAESMRKLKERKRGGFKKAIILEAIE